MKVRFVEPTDAELASLATSLKRSQNVGFHPFSVNNPKPNRLYYVTTEETHMMQETRPYGGCPPPKTMPFGDATYWTYRAVHREDADALLLERFASTRTHDRVPQGA